MKGDLGIPGFDFCRFWSDFGTAISEFLADFGTTTVFFGMRVCRSRFLMISGSESGRLGLQNQAFGVRGVAEISFHACWDSVDFGVISTWFPMTLGPIVMSFRGLETGSKVRDFRLVSGGARS